MNLDTKVYEFALILVYRSWSDRFHQELYDRKREDHEPKVTLEVTNDYLLSLNQLVRNAGLMKKVKEARRTIENKYL